MKCELWLSLTLVFSPAQARDKNAMKLTFLFRFITREVLFPLPSFLFQLKRAQAD